jgi:ribose transport system permease protein
VNANPVTTDPGNDEPTIVRPPQQAAGPRVPRGRRALTMAGRMLAAGEAGVIVALVLLVIVFQSLNSAFLSSADIHAILGAVSFVGIIAVGQTILLVAGEFDLSVGSTAGLCAIVSAWLMTKGGLPPAVGLLAGLGTGAVIGLVNGLVVVRFGIPAFIATLGMLYAAQGLTNLITNGNPIYPLPEMVGSVGQATPFVGLGWSVIAMLALLVVGDLVLRRTTLGRNLYATGGNAEVARLVGINTGLYKVVCFVIVGALAGVAGMFVMGSLASGSPTIGSGWELVVIAGVVVGGVSLFGGVGSVLAGLIGMLLLQVVQSGLVVAGVSANWQTVAVGVIMVLAVGLDLFRRRVSAGQALKARTSAARPEAETPSQGPDREVTGALASKEGEV